jgi:hypothetical protein
MTVSFVFKSKIERLEISRAILSRIANRYPQFVSPRESSSFKSRAHPGIGMGGTKKSDE